jgi:uncharacterized protein (TIGR00297 family)
VIARAAAGLLLAAVFALLAHRARSLSRSGALAATLVGGAAVAAGWSWGVLLIAYFAASVLLSRLRAAEKARRTGGVVAKGGARDAAQVLANGGLFAVAALLSSATGDARLAMAALGALAASTADTWATEIGTLASGAPRSILTMRPVPAGTSGGMSGAGTLAMLAGAAFVALAGRALGIPAPLLAVAAGGAAGALADSLLGATLQERRWCETCKSPTERDVHGCGSTTTHLGGLEWLDNDAVNLLATLVGAAVAAALAQL